jgi:hypothetical protein
VAIVDTVRKLALGAATVAAAVVLAACGGGGSSSSSGASSQPSAANAANAVPITVAQGLHNFANMGTVSVTICAPGTSQCQTLDNIQLDTGSYGLRVVASELSSIAGSLPQNKVPTNPSAPLASCARFADGYAFGSVRAADVKLGGRTASAIPIQLIGDSAVPSAPSGCSSAGRSENTQTELGARGILGVGVSPVDCGSQCATSAVEGFYYDCANTSNCTATTVPVANQVANPVASLPVDNNGVIVQMPSIGPSGQSSVTGALVLGIGTQSNNALDSGATLFTSSSSGSFKATYNGTTMTAFTDTGSNGLFFPDSSLPVCGSFYCPPSPVSKSVAVTGNNGASMSIAFNVANAQTLLSTSNTFAFNNLAGPMSSTFDLGMPFFYGRHVAVAISGKTTPAGNGPFVAF